MLLKSIFLIYSFFLLGQSNATSRKTGPRVANYPEEAELEIGDLAAYYGYTMESHEVQTEDGYILTVHRIPHGKTNADVTDKPAVLMIPGLLCSSACFLLNGANNSTAFVLANSGYDVWIGNPRGTTYSRRHLNLDPNVNKQTFWDFSFHEIGYFDATAFIDYILQNTGQEKVFYIGHSQGTTAYFAMAAARPEYNDKIRLMTALAPVSFMRNIPSPILRILAENEILLSIATMSLDFYEIFPHWDIITDFGKELCSDGSDMQELCIQLWSLVSGHNEAQFNKTLLPVILSKLPAGASMKQIIHYGQEIVSGKFRQFHYGFLLNLIRYGQLEPPTYDVTQVTSPVALFYSTEDQFTSPTDVAELANTLPNVVLTHLVEDELFTHIDFMLANEINKLLHDPLLSVMQKY